MASATRPAIEITPATEADLDAIRALLGQTDQLHAELVPDYFRKPNSKTRPREALKRVLETPNEQLLIARAGGVALGVAHVQLYDTPPLLLLMPRRRAHLDALVVDKSARRRGVGKRLVEAAAAWAKRHDAYELLLTVWAGNDTADRFYAKLGFRVVNRVLGRAL